MLDRPGPVADGRIKVVGTTAEENEENGAKSALEPPAEWSGLEVGVDLNWSVDDCPKLDGGAGFGTDEPAPEI